jgi:hypothetical protein
MCAAHVAASAALADRLQRPSAAAPVTPIDLAHATVSALSQAFASAPRLALEMQPAGVELMQAATRLALQTPAAPDLLAVCTSILDPAARSPHLAAWLVTSSMADEVLSAMRQAGPMWANDSEVSSCAVPGSAACSSAGQLCEPQPCSRPSVTPVHRGGGESPAAPGKGDSALADLAPAASALEGLLATTDVPVAGVLARLQQQALPAAVPLARGLQA